ncbi:MAG: hypothetical protein HY320_16085 [Armatimonadetes bacterium]|nr:hypothetical protein [Armatimonadota bacterium]
MPPILLLIGLLVGSQSPSPTVGVVDAPAIHRWLADVGVESRRLSGEQLSAASLQGLTLVVVPLSAVRTQAAAEALADFAAQKGRLLGLYWGVLRREPEPGRDPLCTLAPAFGIRPIGWRAAAPQPIRIVDPNPGWLPYGGATASLASPMTAVVVPLEGAVVLARWGAAEDAAPAAVLRGACLYLPAHLLLPRNADRPETRDLFFWALQRLEPRVGRPALARERLRVTAELVDLAEDAVDKQPDKHHLLARVEDARLNLLMGRAHSQPGEWDIALRAADRARLLATQVLELTRPE